MDQCLPSPRSFRNDVYHYIVNQTDATPTQATVIASEAERYAEAWEQYKNRPHDVSFAMKVIMEKESKELKK